MKVYELVYIVSPELSSEEVEAKSKEIEAAITSREGTIVKQSSPAAKTLSYPIKKFASGFMGFVEFQIDEVKLLEVKGILEKDSKIVRHMVTIKKPAEFKKARRTRNKPEVEEQPAVAVIEEQKIEEPAVVEEKAEEAEEKPAKEKVSKAKKEKEKDKVELKDIEHELDEILG